jgi:DNA transposition AAA+ family ATPase
MPGYSEELRAKLEAYRIQGRERPLTMSALGRELGVSATRVNKYLNLRPDGKAPEGDIETLEARIPDLLESAARRTVTDVAPFQTNVTRLLIGVFELIRKTNDVGLIAGPAGVGKTVAIRIYTADHPTALAVSVPRWQRTDAGIVALLFGAMETGTWDGHSPRANYMAKRLKGSNRPLIVDNAQRLTCGAREWLFDFHDETGCPVALIGNPEVLQAIRGNDQHFSRVGIYQEVRLDQRHCRDYARNLIDALVPSPDPGLYDLGLAVAEERGHLRALKKQLLLMLDLVNTSAFGGDQLKAFHAAHTKLVRDYQL